MLIHFLSFIYKIYSFFIYYSLSSGVTFISFFTQDYLMEMPHLRRARRSFIFNYLIGFGLLAYLFFSDAILILPPELTVFFIILISVFFIEPEFILSYSSYQLKQDNISEVRGYLSKRENTIPYSSISNVVIQKSIFGRILGFGDVRINSFSGENNVILKGIKTPERILSFLEGTIKK